MSGDTEVHDVFLSYAHTDNEPEDPAEPGWVEQFGRHLELRLRKLSGRKNISVWRDKKLGGAELFDKAIESAVLGSRIMVSLISKSYINSEYCAQEIEWFRKKAAEEPVGLEIGNTLRVFAVLLQNLEPDQWPAGVKGTSAFPLHSIKDTRLQKKRLGEALDVKSAEFESAVQTLAEEVNAILESIEESERKPASRTGARSSKPTSTGSASSPSPDEDEEDDGVFRVFLSQAPDDMRSQSRRLVNDLKGQGIEVLAQLPPPYDEADHAASAEAAMARADLCIHLLGKSPGEAIDDEDEDTIKTFPVVQTRIGLELARSQLILQPETLDFELVDDPEYRAFLEELDRRERDPSRFEVVRTDKNRMLDIILEKKAALEEARARAVEARAGMTAFVDMNLRDFAGSVDMVDYLAKQNVAPLLAPSVDPKQGMRLFEENLKRAELYILFYGEVTADWVLHRLQEAQKLKHANNLNNKIAIYAAPPFKSPSDTNFDPYPVIQNSGGFDPKTLDALLS